MKIAFLLNLLCSLTLANGQCVDNPDYSYNSAKKTCQWISNKESRTKKLCKAWKVKTECKVTCNNCPCVDEEGTFSGPPAGDKTCAYFIGKPNRAEKWCKVPEVAQLCRQSCGTCCGNTKGYKFSTLKGESKSCGFIKSGWQKDTYCVDETETRCAKACGCKSFTTEPTQPPVKSNDGTGTDDD